MRISVRESAYQCPRKCVSVSERCVSVSAFLSGRGLRPNYPIYPIRVWGGCPCPLGGRATLVSSTVCPGGKQRHDSASTFPLGRAHTSIVLLSDPDRRGKAHRESKQVSSFWTAARKMERIGLLGIGYYGDLKLCPPRALGGELPDAKRGEGAGKTPRPCSSVRISLWWRAPPQLPHTALVVWVGSAAGVLFRSAQPNPTRLAVGKNDKLSFLPV